MHTIEEFRTIFLNYLEQNKFTESPIELYEPNNYFLQIGGKRLRPSLLLFCTELFGQNYKNALDAALATEYFHNFTLIHDDIMDDAPLRRGFQTVHEKYSTTTAILSGDVLLIKAYQALSRIEAQYFYSVYQIFTKTAIEVCEGQQMDINFEQCLSISHTDYIEMIRLKTAVLLAASLQIGAIIGGATNEDAEHIYNYGINLGIAFQIQDDILDCFGQTEQVGKQLGGDILQNKKTLLMIEALERSANNNDTKLQSILIDKNHTDKVQKVLQIFKQYQIEEYGIQIRTNYINNALQHLSKLSLKEEQKQLLKNMINNLVYRAF